MHPPVTHPGVTEEQLLARKAREARLVAAQHRVIEAAKDWAAWKDLRPGIPDDGMRRAANLLLEANLAEAVKALGELESSETGA